MELGRKSAISGLEKDRKSPENPTSLSKVPEYTIGLAMRQYIVNV